jgi:hypothetical protein
MVISMFRVVSVLLRSDWDEGGAAVFSSSALLPYGGLVVLSLLGSDLHPSISLFFLLITVL